MILHDFGWFYSIFFRVFWFTRGRISRYFLLYCLHAAQHKLKIAGSSSKILLGSSLARERTQFKYQKLPILACFCVLQKLFFQFLPPSNSLRAIASALHLYWCLKHSEWNPRRKVIILNSGLNIAPSLFLCGTLQVLHRGIKKHFNTA